MWSWLTNQYRRRIININVNITVASVIAAVGGTIVIHLTRYVGIRQDDKTLLMLIGAAADWLIDLILAIGLHWVANHWPDRWRRSKLLIERAEDVIESAPPPGLSVIKDATHGTHLPHIPGLGHDKEHPATPARTSGPPPCEKPGFVRDATTLQLQRLCLSPVFYGVAMGGNWLMLHWQVGRELSFAAPFALAIVVTRLIHTVWLYKADPQVLAEYEAWQLQRRSRDAQEDAQRAALRHPAGAASPPSP